MIDAAAPFDATTRVHGRTWDVVVIGAGPAGATAARILAERGHATLLLDRHAFPRDKVCGDGLIPDTIRSLQRAGLLEAVEAEAFRSSRLSVFSPTAVGVDIPGRFLTLRRRRLDHLLLDAARRCGAHFLATTAAAVDSNDRWVYVRVKGARDGIRARYAVLATGADTRLRSQGATDRSTGAVALRCYVASPVDLPHLIISFDRAVLPGYAWVFPLGQGWYNMGCGIFHSSRRNAHVNLRQTFAAFADQFAIARDIWQRRTASTPLAGARLRCGLEPTGSYDGGRIVAVGETIAATFPFTGEGIGKAMETAELAARQVDMALRAEDPRALSQYPSLLESRLAPLYDGYRVAERWIRWPRLTDFVARRVAHSDRLLQAAAGVLSETTDPRQIFSARALVPALFSRRS